MLKLVLICKGLKMKKLIASVLSFSMFFSSALPTYAASAPKKLRLENYFIDPKVDFAWMTQEERAAYIGYLYSLQILIDAELSGNMVIESEPLATKTSKLDLILRLLQPAIGAQDAEAFLQLVPIAGAIIATGVRALAPRAIAYATSRAVVTTAASTAVRTVAPTVARREIFMGAAEVVGSPTLTTTVASSAAATAAGSSWVGAATIGTAITGASLVSDGTVTPAGKVAPAKAVEPKAADSKAAEAKGSAQKATTADAPAPAADANASYRQAGEFCLFGGYASKYVKSKTGGRMVCPAPAETVNTSTCSDVPTPNFLCQSMGLSESTKLVQVTNKLCVPLLSKEKGLSNISARCADTFANKFLPEVKAISVDDLKIAQEKVAQGLAKLEAEKGISGIGYLEYCKSENSVNKSLQATPCVVLNLMVTEFKKLAPAFTKQVELAAAQKEAAPDKNGKVKTTN